MDNLLTKLIDRLFPPFCLACGAWGSEVCDGCLLEVAVLGEAYCVVCGFPSSNGVTHAQCYTPSSPEKCLSVFRFSGLPRQIILSAKYAGAYFTDLQTFVRKVLAFDLIDLPDLDGVLVIPVPLYSSRLHERGFNQSALIAKILGEKLGGEFNAHSLLKVKDTKAQATLQKEARIMNLAGVFKCATALQGRDVLLVDDVCTTGATFMACTEALKLAGARYVYCFSLAKTL